LNVQAGCTSYKDLKTVNGHVYDSYREACGALRLLEDDREFIDSILEVAFLGSGVSLRQMFAKLLMSNSMSDPLNAWNQLSETLSDGILFKKRRELQNPGKFNINIFVIYLFLNTVILFTFVFYILVFIVTIDSYFFEIVM
jgi:ATP-dependent DNA helicase PIF1